MPRLRLWGGTNALVSASATVLPAKTMRPSSRRSRPAIMRKRRGLAAAGGSQQREHVPALHLERHAVDRPRRAKQLGHFLQAEDDVSHRFLPTIAKDVAAGCDCKRFVPKRVASRRHAVHIRCAEQGISRTSVGNARAPTARLAEDLHGEFLRLEDLVDQRLGVDLDVVHALPRAPGLDPGRGRRSAGCCPETGWSRRCCLLWRAPS